MRLCSIKKVFSEVSQNSQENTNVGAFFDKAVRCRYAISIIKGLQHRCFIANYCRDTLFAEQLRTTSSDYSSINSTEMKSTNETVNYDTEIKAYQFELEVGVMKNINPGERTGLNLSWRKSVSYRNQSVDLLFRSMDCFLYDTDLSHERFKLVQLSVIHATVN